uniref:SH3 domain-containing protein n=1 Tax=Anopheles atroparvus TaxID=41427 RepID=A0AAG5DJH4_ANOAO
MIKRNYDVQHVATAGGVGSKHGKSSSNLFDKLTKRYSGVIGTRFLRKTPGRKGGVAEPLSDSYDMCGTRSDDFRPEIGAPVLISKTMKFDFDTDSSVEQLPLPRVPSARVMGRPAGTPSTSEDSENDVFLDANSSLPNFGEIKFTFLPESNNNCRSFQNENVIGRSGMGEEAGGRRQLEKSRSKSAYNLHHHHHHHAHSAEVRLSLYSKAPSLNLSGNSDGLVYLGHQTPKAAHGNGGIPQCTVSVPNSPAVESIYDFPRSTRSDGIRKPPGESSYDLSRSHHVLNEINLSLVSDGDNLYQNLPSPATTTTTTHYDVPPPLLGGDRDSHQQQSFDSDRSGGSSSSRSTREEEFDLKSASLQSLADAGTGAGQLAVSMEELNELTRQINESAAFRGSGVIAQLPDSDEYCEHRKQLHPSERRLTLLKNRSAPGKHFIDFDRRKAKITKKWSGFKSWIGEEQGRIREVVQKHAAMQRVGEANTGGATVQRNNSDLTTSATSDADSRTENEASASGLPTPPESTVVRRDRTLSSEDREGSRTMQRKSANAEILEGQNGFEEVRRFVKQGGDFGKDLVAILHERTEIEQLYAKSLSKIANKLNKACRDLPGTIAESWRSVSAELEGRSEVHRQFSNSLAEEVVKPLKAVIENQHKARKTIETNVDKSARILAEWRTAEMKAKKNSHGAARENEKLQDAMLDVKLQRTPSIGLLHKTNEKDTKVSEKDSSKLEGKRKKAEEAVKKADVEYYTLCIRAERARVDWEMSVLRGSSMLQTLEGQRLAQFKTHVSDYLKLSAEMSPLLTKTIDRLSPQVAMCSVAKDLDVLKNIRRATEGPSEQLLPDFYCEHTTLAMNRERRKQSLVKLLQLIRQDLDRERRSRNGLKGFSQTLDKNGESNQNIADKLYHIRSMLTYLEGARYKLQSALLELDHKPRSSHPLAQHIQITRDRTGLQTSVLKVPLWLKHDHEDEGNLETSGGANGRDYSAHSNGTTASDESGEQNCLDIKNDTLIKHIVHKYARNGCNGEEGHYTVNKAGKSALHDENSPVWDRGVADGVSNQPDSDFDEFSSQDEDDDPKQAQENVGGAKADGTDTGCSGAAPSQQPVVLGHCRALFNYTPKLYDELELQPGDILEVHIKQEDGWWLGALRGQIGIFPATYVEEIP